MAVKLNVQANVTGQQQLARLNNGLRGLGNQALIAKKRLASLRSQVPLEQEQLLQL